MNRKKTLLIAAVLVVAAAGAFATLAGGAPDAEHITVNASSAGTGILAVGKIKPAESTELVAEVSGTILSAPITEGSAVTRGTVLFVIDGGDQSQLVEQKKAAYENAAAQLELLEQTRLPDARENADQTMLELASAENAYKDAQRLYEAGAISKDGLEDARLDYESAKSDHASALRSLGSLAAGGAGRKQAEAALRAARADYDNALLLESKYTITSAQDGILARKEADAGAYVRVGTPLGLVAALDDLYIAAELDERYFGFLQPGMKADAFIDSDARYSAEVTAVSPKIDPETGSFPIQLSLDPAFPFKAADLAVNIEIRPDEAESYFSIPASYIFDAEGTSCVWKYSGGRITKAVVTPGPSFPGQATVKAGIAEGDILVKPQADFRDGARVALDL